MPSPSVLLSVPPELIERILTFCHARDVSKFAQTCHSAHHLVYESQDQYLWRELFLAQPFDDPRKALIPGREPPVDLDWKKELQHRTEAELVSRSFSPLTLLGPKISFDRVLETFVFAVETAIPVIDGDDQECVASGNLSWVEEVLRNSLFLFADDLSSSESYKRLQSQLRAYFALCYEETTTDENKKRMNVARRTSRCFVYDLRKYSEATLWGPFCAALNPEEITVNWTHVEHIVNVVGMKLRELLPVARKIFKPPFYGLRATRAYSAPSSFKRQPYDWAGVTGVWRRMVCFMDYRDLFAFNFSSSHSGPRNPSFFNDDYQEALRPVELHLEAVDPEEKFEDKYPILYFKGFSRGSYSPEAVVSGSVRLLEDGCIRWSFITKYDGLTQWSAEGVQLGNVCSAAGVAGIWTGAFHEEGDPAGPFWMWKVVDEDNLSSAFIEAHIY